MTIDFKIRQAVINYSDKYYNVLKRVLKPSRYIGGEINQVLKEKTDYGIHFCLAFPDTYEIGMSHLGLRILYHYLNKEKDIFTERLFAPWPDMEKELREANIPLLSLESKTPLNQFDVVGFSLQYELEYSNVLNMLDMGGIPIYSADRSDNVPIILAGGPVALNPEPMAPFIDVFVLGDGENITADLLRAIKKGKHSGIPRKGLLKNLTAIPGVYVPSLYKTEYDDSAKKILVKSTKNIPYPVKKNLLEEIDDYPFPTDIIVPHHEIVHDRISIEIARGCTQGCRFCQAGFTYRPVRERSGRSIVNSIVNSVANTGYKEASLTSLSPADYSGISPMVSCLVENLSPKHIGMHISSLRVYGLSKKIAEQLGRGRKSGFTIAPEAGSQRLRDVINKNISEEDIHTAVTNTFEQGWEQIKLYTMIGLPTETDEDVEAIADMAIKIWKTGKSIIGKKARISLAVSTFIPKPFTPFQWVGFISKEELKRKQKIIMEKIIPYKKIKFDFNNYQISVLEAMLSRGDRKIADVIFKTWQNGARFDAWHDFFDFERWENAISESSVDLETYLSASEPESPLCWDHIDIGVTKSFLINEYEKSLKAATTPPCEQPLLKDPKEKTRAILDDKNFVCYNCGLDCNLPEIKEKQKNGLQNWDKVDNEIKQSLIEPQYKLETGKYLLNFSKKRPIHLLSHLDTVQLITRLFHRCGIEIKYSEGFRPRPVISLARALGLGIESLDEWMIITLKHDRNPEELLNVLNSNAPQGMKFIKVIKPDIKIIWDNYFTEQYFSINIPTTEISFTEFEKQVKKYDECHDRIIEKETKKKKVRSVNLKDFFTIEEFIKEEEWIKLNIRLLSLPSGSARISDFLDNVFSVSINECNIVKTNALPAII